MIFLLVRLAIIAVAIGGNAFFAGSETSLVSSNRFRISAMAKRRVRGASTACWLLDNPSTVLSVTLVGTNLFLILASSLTTDLLGRLLGSYAIPVSTLLITGLILMFGEITPKAVARSQPEAFLARAAPGLAVAYYVLYPVARATAGIAILFMRLTRSHEAQASVTRDEIRALVKETAQRGLALGSHRYAHRVLDLSLTKVTNAMIPMDEVVCINEESTIRDALAIASRSGHSRYPVFSRTPDNLVGILHLRDLLGAPLSSKVKVFARRGYFVPETKVVSQAISEMRNEVRHLAIVTDEYGRPIGIVTFEDLVEEITGEIRDEYDPTSESPIRLDSVFSGSTAVQTVREELDIPIPEGHYDTVAGFILDRAGALGEPGDVVEFRGFLFHVVEVKRRRIWKVKITRLE
jgi:CBS domain containing-hemolysin-like protein